MLRFVGEIAAVRIRYGYRRITVLLNREGWNINHKRVYGFTAKPICICKASAPNGGGLPLTVCNVLM